MKTVFCFLLLTGLIATIHGAPAFGEPIDSRKLRQLHQKVKDGQHLRWEWSDDVSWEADVQMTMDADVANRYFQGKENVAMAIARRRIKTSGNVKKALALLPITKPVYKQYREMLEDEYPHLVA